MTRSRLLLRLRGFTLIEAIVTVAILAVILVLTAPSAMDWIVMQRVKASAAEMVTDIRFARGEAIKRNVRVVIAFQSVAGDQTCYSVHTQYFNERKPCVCTKGAGRACDKGADPDVPELWDTLVELKTVSAPARNRVAIAASRNVTFLASNGFPDANPAAFQVDFDGQNGRMLRVVTNGTGRPQVCAPSGSRIGGYPSCV